MMTHRSLPLVALLVLVLACAGSADSPVTSTPFADAYVDDYEIVGVAADSGVMTLEIAAYLSNEDNPVDVKAAVVNALSWDFEGKSNAAIYCEMRFPGAEGIPDPRDVSGEDALVIGYLQVMDDYFKPRTAMPMLRRAREELPDSLTVALVGALCRGQILMEDPDVWARIWENTAEVLEDEGLNGDMRMGAVDIIVEYMSLYDEDD